jgi:hypothetical protein
MKRFGLHLNRQNPRLLTGKVVMIQTCPGRLQLFGRQASCIKLTQVDNVRDNGAAASLFALVN